MVQPCRSESILAQGQGIVNGFATESPRHLLGPVAFLARRRCPKRGPGSTPFVIAEKWCYNWSEIGAIERG